MLPADLCTFLEGKQQLKACALPLPAALPLLLASYSAQWCFDKVCASAQEAQVAVSCRNQKKDS